MNIKKLSNGFNTNTGIDNPMSRFIQEARVNAELENMNKNITIKDIKNIFDELFKQYPEFTLFNKKEEIENYNSLFEPYTGEKHYSPFNKNAIAYCNKAKNFLFMACPAIGDANIICNAICFIISNYNNENSKTEKSYRLSFMNELEDLKNDLEYKIFNVLHAPDYTPIKFEDLTLDFNWFPYTNMKILTSDCYKQGICKKKNCPNCNKCKQFYPMIEFTQNMYEYNNEVNKFIENICKSTKHRVKVIQEKTQVKYTIGRLTFNFAFAKRHDKTKSSMMINVYSTRNHKKTYLMNYNADKPNYGKEMLEIFNKFKKDFNNQKNNILKSI